MPSNWEVRAVGDIAEVQGGLQKQPKRRPISNRYPFLRVANVLRGRLDLSEVHQIELFGDEPERYRLKPGDLLVVEGNGSKDQVGRSAIWTGEIKDCVHQNHIIRVRPGPTLDPKFLHYYWNSPANSERVIGVASSTSGLYVLSGSKVRGIEVPVPPLDEQHRIVAAIEEQFSHLDAGMTGLERVGHQAERLRNALLQAAVTGGLTRGRPADRQPQGRRHDCGTPPLPLGWTWKRVGDLAEVQGGIQKQPKRRPALNPHPYLRVANVLRGRLDLSQIEMMELFPGELERFVLQPGDLLVVEGNGSRGQIGRSALWGGELTGCVHQNHIIRVRPGSDLVPEYLHIYWNSPAAAERLQEAASTTSGLYTLNTQKIKDVQVAVPPIEEQRTIVGEVDRQLSLATSLARACEALSVRGTALRRSILRSAFSGRLTHELAVSRP